MYASWSMHLFLVVINSPSFIITNYGTSGKTLSYFQLLHLCQINLIWFAFQIQIDDKTLCVYLGPCVYFQIRNTFLLYIECNYWMILLAQKGHPTTSNLSGYLKWLYNINNFRISFQWNFLAWPRFKFNLDLWQATYSSVLEHTLLKSKRLFAMLHFAQNEWSCSGNTIFKNFVVMRGLSSTYNTIWANSIAR